MTLDKNQVPLDFWRPTLRLGIPVAIQNLLYGSSGLVDTLMIGQLGETAISSVGMAAQWSWLMGIFFYGFQSGAAVFLSQYWGAKDFPGIRRAYGILAVGCESIAVLMGLVAVLFPSLIMALFTADPAVAQTGVDYLRIAGFSYVGVALSNVFSTVLRSTEQVKLPMYGSILAVFTNMALNYALIFGKFGLPEMGVRGAALATVISAWISPVVVFTVSFAKRNLLICKLKDLLSFDMPFVRKYIRISAPVLANEMIWSVGTMGYGMIYGHLGTDYYTAYTIFRTIEGIFFSFYIGLCHACGVLIGREIGAGRADLSIRYAKKYAVVMPMISVLFGALMVGAGGLILAVDLFKISGAVAALTRTLMILFALNIPIRNISFICVCGIVRPGGDTRIGLLYDGLSVWCIALPMTLLAAFALKLPFIWVYVVMLASEDWIKSFLCIRRLNSLKWVKPVVERAEAV